MTSAYAKLHPPGAAPHQVEFGEAGVNRKLSQAGAPHLQRSTEAAAQENQGGGQGRQVMTRFQNQDVQNLTGNMHEDG